MKKTYLIMAVALAALASCSDDTFIGDQGQREAMEGGVISFTSSSKAVTRANDNATSAELLNHNFVVFGYKTVSSTPSTVFDNYQVNWVTNTANTTESNSANWEYVGYKNLPYGTGTKSEETITLNNNGVAANANGIDQSIKYWDFSASQYDFFAYSLGTGEADNDDEGTDPQYAKASALSNSTYTLEGNATQLGACYISNKNTITSLSTSATEVDLEFRSFLSKIELKFYETIPGYSVKSLSFYSSSAGTAAETPYLFTADNVFPTGGKYTVTFDANGKAQLTLETSSPTPTKTKTTAFSNTLTNYKGAEYKEANGSYLGRASNDATTTNTITMLPNPQNANALNLKIDFTLVSRDGTGEEINCKGATAVIPAAYAKWLPNYKYTYIFKISDNTNAQIGTITGLYPITLDAVVSDAVDGTQETITTVDDPSITTYAKGTMVTANNEYMTDANIYIVVDNGTALTVSGEGTNAKLYTATIQEGAAQSITEETVANALANGTESPSGTWTVTDANNKNLVVTSASGLSEITEIAETDAPDGYAITVNGAKFTPASAGNYVFEYTASVAQYYDDGAANTHNAALPGAISTTDDAYTFESYGVEECTPETQYGNGKAKVLSTEYGWTTVLVTSNTPPGDDPNAATFVGKQFKIKATSVTADKAYQLYDLEGNALPIWVKMSTTTNKYSDSEVNTFNATLPGAVESGDIKTPAAKHYKVIKVVN